jgi:hypothetical protein
MRGVPLSCRFKAKSHPLMQQNANGHFLEIVELFFALLIGA